MKRSDFIILIRGTLGVLESALSPLSISPHRIRSFLIKTHEEKKQSRHSTTSSYEEKMRSMAYSSLALESVVQQDAL